VLSPSIRAWACMISATSPPVRPSAADCPTHPPWYESWYATRRASTRAVACWWARTTALSMALPSFTMVGRGADLPVISPEKVTDYIHAVIEADRTFYTIHVVERTQKQGGSPAAENWRVEKKTSPLPVQFLAEASDLASKTGTKVRYQLISLWPINPHNVPDGEPEKNR
jgi:hypothetical protein